MLIAEEVVRGDRFDSSNLFHWDTIELNLPGSPRYDPLKPWIAKIRSSDGSPAADFFIYIDDERIFAGLEEETWEASHRLAAILQYLGIQDAPRKVREVSQAPGAWAGAVVYVTADGIFLLTSEEKWDRTKTAINKWHERVSKQEPLDFREL